MGLVEAKKILADSEKHSRRLVEQAQEVVEKFTQKGEKPMKLVEGKTKMAYGGTVMGKSQVASIFKRGKDAIRKNKKV